MRNIEQVVRFINYVELECGRGSPLNPRLVNCVTLVRRFDPQTNDFRPYVIPSVQIFDPFNEISFHTNNLNCSSTHVTAASPLQMSL